MNRSFATFLLSDPFGVGVEDFAAEIKDIRTLSGPAMRMADAATATEAALDLDLVSKATADTSGGTLFLMLRCMEMACRAGAGPETVAEVQRLKWLIHGICRALLPEEEAGET